MKKTATSALAFLLLSVAALAQPKTEGAGRDTSPFDLDFPLMPLVVGLVVGLIIGYLLGSRAKKA